MCLVHCGGPENDTPDLYNQVFFESQRQDRGIQRIIAHSEAQKRREEARKRAEEKDGSEFSGFVFAESRAESASMKPENSDESKEKDKPYIGFWLMIKMLIF